MARHGEMPPGSGPAIAPAYGSDMLPDETSSERILKACCEGSEPLDVALHECLQQLQQEQADSSNGGLRWCQQLWMVYNSLELAANLPFTMLSQHLWQAVSAYLRHAEMGHSDAECLEYVLAAAGTVHGIWAKALMDEGRHAMQEAMHKTLEEWQLLAQQATDVDFLSSWESERLRREAGVIGKEASETRSKLVHSDDVADTEGLDPDCFRLEACGCPADASATLHPPIPARNSRAGRQFGSDRFLMVRMKRLRPPGQFDFLRRRWRLLYWKVPDQVTYFAEKGPGLEEQSVETVWNELVPMAVNQDMTLCKFNQRLQLSFSETRADTCLSVRLEEDLWDSERAEESLHEVTLVAHLFLYRTFPDVHQDSGRFCLSDGCGCISQGAAEAVAAKLGFDEVPSAFQARCGPWKGLWVLDPQLGSGMDLVVRPSQKKYRPLAEVGFSCETEEDLDLSFEVINTSSRHWHCCLTANSIQALESLGVSAETFVKLQQEVLDAIAPLLKGDEASGHAALERLLNAQIIKAGLQKPLHAFMDLQVPWQEPNFVDLRFRVCTDLRRRAGEDLPAPCPCRFIVSARLAVGWRPGFNVAGEGVGVVVAVLGGVVVAVEPEVNGRRTAPGRVADMGEIVVTAASVVLVGLVIMAI
ncbi:RDR2 [Symbiodinium sp. CCMP2592]|nr:RDR2 [Symbiodinium sp. CCMP2592]